MSRRVLVLGAALLAVVAVAAGCGPGAGGPSARPTSSPRADRLPDVSLPSLGDGPAVAMGTLRGPLVVNLWASWCPPCERELPYYAAFAREYQGRVSVMGVDFQDGNPDKAREMLGDAGADYPVVVDFDGEFRALGLPRLMLVDAAGTVVFDEYREIHGLAELTDLVQEHLGVAP